MTFRKSNEIRFFGADAPGLSPPGERSRCFHPDRVRLTTSQGSLARSRGGNAATLPTLKRRADTRLRVFRRRRNTQGTQRVHRMMWTQYAFGSAASMKRGGAEVALAHLERVRRTPQSVCSRRHQALSQGGRALPCLVKMNLLRQQAHWFLPCCRVHWARPMLQC